MASTFGEVLLADGNFCGIMQILARGAFAALTCDTVSISSVPSSGRKSAGSIVQHFEKEGVNESVPVEVKVRQRTVLTLREKLGYPEVGSLLATDTAGLLAYGGREDAPLALVL